MSASGGDAAHGTESTRLVLSPHAALKTRRQGDVLVLPERAIRLGGSGGEILRGFERARSIREVAAALAARYPTSEGIEAEVVRFAEQMRRLGALVEAGAGTGAATAEAPEAEAEADAAALALASAATSAAASLGPSRDAAANANGSDRSTNAETDTPVPLNLIAELTYRCPLQCAYCSNPIDFRSRRESLDADTWGRVFAQAARLGVVHLGLTGGEPSTRSDLEAIVDRAVEADLYPHLVTAGRPLTLERLETMAERGLRSVQVSIQAVDAERSDRIAGTPSFTEKLAIARRTSELGLALTINCVLHRHNLDQVAELIELSIELGAMRLELANTQFHNWALRNRAALMPSRAQLEAASATVKASRARAEAHGLTVLFVLPDYYAGRPKPCMGGWGRLALVVDPTGLVLPCHEASDLPGLEFWRVPERTLEDAWSAAPGMQAHRGTAWMREPCRSCPERERDFGGCRCQAHRLLGDASMTDPACSLSPDHALVVAARDERSDVFVPRR